MNNPSLKVLKGLRAAFVGFRWLFILCVLGVVYQMIVGPASLTATIGLAPDSTTVVRNTSAPEALLHLGGLKADVKVPVGTAADAQLKTVARLATLPWMGAAAFAGLVLCEIVQRMIKNLETGELFSDRNVKLLRVFAIVLVASAVIVRVLEGAGNYLFGEYAAAHLTVTGARVLASAEHTAIGEFQLSLGNADVLVALLLLLILLAFKQGAALKQDSELTI